MTQRRIYQNEFPYHITICSARKDYILTDINTINIVIKYIKHFSIILDYSVLAYAIMINHVHLVISIHGKYNISDIIWAIKMYSAKQIVRKNSLATADHKVIHCSERNRRKNPIPPPTADCGAVRCAKPIPIPPSTADCGAVRCAKIKSSSSKRHSNSIWQKSFNFKIILSEKQLLNTLIYIANNDTHHQQLTNNRSSRLYLNHTLIKKYLS